MKKPRILIINCDCELKTHAIRKEGTSFLPECLINKMYTAPGEKPLISVNHIACMGTAFYAREITQENIREIFLCNGEKAPSGERVVCWSCKELLRFGDLHYQV